MRALALRLNLVCDGRRHSVESAYAQIGPDAGATAGARGGEIRPLTAVLPHLAQRHGQKALSVGTSDLEQICVRAREAANVFEDLLLIGLDLVLDVDERGELLPVFLEANPRPAGLSRSRFLNSSLPGVGTKLWDGLEYHCGHRDVSHAA